MSNGNYLFLSGAAMHPTAVRAAWPGARFIARAHLIAGEAEIATQFARALVDRGETATVWGIALETPEPVAGESRAAATDEGRPIEVIVAERPLVGGEPEAALNAALYWELPPAYTSILREAAGVAPPEPEGGWETPPIDAESPAGDA